MHHDPCECISSLSASDRASVAHCQKIALELGLRVVSQGVFAADAGELAGGSFWLVGAPAVRGAAVPSPLQIVWLAGRRLMCGCKRRRSNGALTCCHAQIVRLWLLAAAGARVPVEVSSLVGASAPTPAQPDPAPVADHVAEVAPEREPAIPDEDMCPCNARQYGRVATRPACDACARYWREHPEEAPEVAPVADPAPDPAPVAEGAPEAQPDPAPAESAESAESPDMARCPECGELETPAILAELGMCMDCVEKLTLAADRTAQPAPRCDDCKQARAVGETERGRYCAECLPIHKQRDPQMRGGSWQTAPDFDESRRFVVSK